MTKDFDGTNWNVEHSQARPPRPGSVMDLEVDIVEPGMTVSDLNASLQFYVGLLGFVPKQVAAGPGNGGVLVLELGDVRLKLFQCQSATLVPNTPGGVGPLGDGWAPGGQYGFRWLTLKIENLNEVMEDVERLGVAVGVPMTRMPNATFAIIRDPDGTAIELVEYEDLEHYEQFGVHT